MASAKLKFRVNGLHHHEANHTRYDDKGKDTNAVEDMTTVEMSPVRPTGDPADENTRHAADVPNGRLVIDVFNPELAESFAQGKEYYVTIEEAVAKAPQAKPAPTAEAKPEAAKPAQA